MAAFGLDDVRESYTSDVTRFLSDVETHANIVVSAAALALSAERTQQPPIEAMVIGLHGIVGSSSLIGLDTMTGSARRLELIAASAAESVRIMTWHAARLQRIAAVCLDSATDLRAILDHELAGRTSEARSRCTALHVRLDEQAAQLAAVAPAVDGSRPPPLHAMGSEAGFGAVDPTLAQDSTAPRNEARTGGDEADVHDAELVEAFRGEARETLIHLQGYWVRLERDPDDVDAAAHSARLLHLLRGSAVMVGRTSVAARTSELHAWLETVRRQGFTTGAVRELGRAIDDLFDLALGERVTQVRPTPLPPEPSAVDDEPRQLFVVEAARALDELRTLMAELETTAGPVRDAAAGRAERVLHRLKGSALIVGEPAFAELAARGQALCEPLEQVDPGAFGALTRELAAAHAAMTAAPGPATVVVSLAPAAFRFSPPSSEEWDAFLEESSELLDDLDGMLARLEQSVRPTAELSAMFRMYHTLKGASSSVGLTPIAQQLHAIESFVERIVALPELPALRPVVSALADEHAAMRTNIARASGHGSLEVDPRVQARLTAVADRAAHAHASWIAPNDPVWATPVFDAGDAGDIDPLRPRSEVSRLVEPSAHAAREGEPSLNDGFVVGRRFVRVAADRLDGLLDLVGELVVARSRMLTRIARLQRLEEDGDDRQSAVIRLVDDFATSTEFTNLDGRRGRPGARARGSAPRVGGFGVLELDHYEEIHVLSRQLEEAASDIHELRREIATELQQLTEDADALSTVIADLQTEITQARMLTVEALFTRLVLPIRDAAQRVGREVEITTRGEHVAIDKSISDALFGPLLHIVRNAVVHGIEDPARRSALGKPRAGALTLTARQDHGQVILEITDDGQGIDVARLKAAGVARGLIDPGVPDSDPRVLELVFVHGLTTSHEAGDVAGRGVGGNVIRRAVDRLSGSIEITTERATGTTFRIALPLSMSITQAVVLRAAGVTLAIPIAFAEMILARDGVESVDTFGRTRARIAGNLMPVHHAPRLFGDASAADAGVLVVCAVGTERVAIHADAVVGQEEIVVKSLGSLLDGHPLFSGSTQRGDGELVLILDVPGVLAAETSEVHALPDARGAFAAREPSQLFGASQLGASVAGDRLAAPPWTRDASHASLAATAGPAIAAVAAAVVAPGAIAFAELAPVPTGRRRVLFVDDSLSVRKVAERMLRSLGVDVVTAVDGQDALDKLRAMAFSLVFTDLEMPRLHGFDLIREMKYLPAFNSTPVVVISSRSGQKHVDQALAIGAREYLTKPFSPEILQSVLARWVKLESAS